MLLFVPAISSVTLFLFQEEVKFYFYALEIVLIFLVILRLSDVKIKIVLKKIDSHTFNLPLLVSIFQICASFFLLTVLYSPFSIASIFTLTNMVIAMVLCTVSTGYLLLFIFDLNNHFSRCEMLPLSFLVGYTFSWISFLFSLLIATYFRGVFILTLFLTLGFISLLKVLWLQRNEVSAFTSHKISISQDTLIMVVIYISYVFFWSLIYPGSSYALGSDQSRHYRWTVILSRTPEIYSGYPYLAFHLFNGLLLLLSKVHVFDFLTLQVLFNLMIPIAFYSLAKSYLRKVDDTAPIISTVFFSLFSSLAWIYLLKLRLNNMHATDIQLLEVVNEKAWAGAMYMRQPILWYVPISISYLILIIQFMLLIKFDVPRRKFILLFAMLNLSSLLTHSTEAIILTLFLVVYAIMMGNNVIRVKDALLAICFSMAFGAVVYAMLFAVLLRVSDMLSILFSQSVVLLLLSASMYLLCSSNTRSLLSKIGGFKVFNMLRNGMVVKTLVFILLYTYLLGLLTWLSKAPSLNTWPILASGIVPWFIYPLVQGVIGLLALVALVYAINDKSVNLSLLVFTFFALFSLVAGKCITYINVHVFFTSYWEKRFLFYMFFAFSVIASVPIVKTIKPIMIFSANSFSKNTLKLAVISFIMILGLQSTFTVVTYHHITKSPKYWPSENELAAIEYLENAFMQDPYAYALSPSSTSISLLTYAAPSYLPSHPHVFFSARTPEFCFPIFHVYPDSHAYIFVAKRDADMLLERKGSSWLVDHVLPMLPVVYKNDEVTIYRVPEVSFPKPNSMIALVVPFDDRVDFKRRWFYAYDVLSLGKYDYTVLYDLDPRLFRYHTIIMSFDVLEENFIRYIYQYDFTNSTTLNYWRFISGTWELAENGIIIHTNKTVQKCILLADITSAQNFSFSISFKLIEANSSLANYVGVLYDWKDCYNFKYVGLLFYRSNIHLFSAYWKNGKAQFYPKWPGIDTALKWKLGDVFNFTVSISASSIVAYVNNSGPFTIENDAIAVKDRGPIGIMVMRAFSVLFTHFKVEAEYSIHTRHCKEYENYVMHGGRLIILNTNGYYYFASKLFVAGNTTILARRITYSGEEITLPVKLKMPILLPRNDSIEIIACYESHQHSSIFIAKRKIGLGELIYVNLYPIVEKTDETQCKASLFTLLSKLLDPIKELLEPFEFNKLQLSAYFKRVKAIGNVEITSSSILFPLSFSFREMVIKYGVNRTSVLYNVSFVQLLNSSTIWIRSFNVCLSEGLGFYSKIVSWQNVTILSEEAFSLMMVANGSRKCFTDVKLIEIYEETITLYVRSPTIQTIGTVFFDEFYPNSAIYRKTKTSGQDLRVKGSVLMQIYASDTYSRVSSLEMEGLFEREPPLIMYDEFSTLPDTLTWCVIVAFILLIPYFISRERK